MSIEEQGTLSAEISGWINKCHMENHEWFDLVGLLNKISHHFRSHIKVPINNLKLVTAALLFLRGLFHLEGAILLAERCLLLEARTLTRNAYEVLFYLKALLKQPDFIDLFIGDDLARRKKLADILIRQSRDVSGLSPNQIEKLNSFLADIESSEDAVKPLLIEKVARLAESEDVYDLCYKNLSNSAAHVSVSSLNHYVKTDATNQIIGFRIWPISGEESTVLQDVCDCYIRIIECVNEFFKYSFISDELQQAINKMHFMVEKKANALNEKEKQWN